MKVSLKIANKTAEERLLNFEKYLLQQWVEVSEWDGKSESKAVVFRCPACDERFEMVPEAGELLEDLIIPLRFCPICGSQNG